MPYIYMVTFTINIPPNVSIYTIHGSYGLYSYATIHNHFVIARNKKLGHSMLGTRNVQALLAG